MKKVKLSNSQILIFGFLCVILIGTFLLSLPISSRSGEWTNFITSLFTATSATCVTGLVVVDTGTYWSLFGQIVILFLIQVGGIGFMTLISAIALLLGRKVNLHERSLIESSSGSTGDEGVLHLLKRIIILTAACEIGGMILLSTQFIPAYGVKRGLYYSLFHSVSAFCNAGFDVMGNFKSLTDFTGNIVVNLTIMALVVIGGLGFIVWSDLYNNKFRYKKLSLHSKIVLVTTFILIFGGALVFYLLEKDNAFSELNAGTKVLASFFQSITCRTAGMNTVDQGALHDGSILSSIVLMLIGGSPGSTAGGIKTTTFAVLVMSILSTARKRPHVVVGSRKLDTVSTRQASAVVISYIFLFIISSIILMISESTNDLWDFKNILFEVASAIGTVGLSIAGTSNLHIGSQVIIILLMYVGRIGALAIIFAFSEKLQTKSDVLDRPIEKILIG